VLDLERRKAMNRALAKAIAFQAQGNSSAARNWADRLVRMVTEEFLTEVPRVAGSTK
jgi:hypothetical protein